MAAFDFTPLLRTQYEAELLIEYQQKGSYTRQATWVKPVNQANVARFRKLIGRIDLTMKAAQAEIPITGGQWDKVEVSPTAYYARSLIDDLQEADFTDIDSRRGLVMAQAMGCGVKTDSIIFTAARDSLPTAQKYNSGTADGLSMTLDKALWLRGALTKAFVPLMDTVVFISADEWNELVLTPQFANADYVTDLPWVAGAQAKRWLGLLWVELPAVPTDGTDNFCLCWHRYAMGYAEQKAITASVTFVDDRDSHQIIHKMSGGAKRLWDVGVFEIACRRPS